MKLVELYLEEIRHQLPPKNRDDILQEIRSILMDMIEDHNPSPGQQPDEETIKFVLQEFGSPRKVAQQFGTKNYLIGPRVFPVYVQVLKIVLIVVASLNLLGSVLALVNQSGTNAIMVNTVLEAVGGLFAGLFTAFSVVTLSFAVIEQTTPEDEKIKVDLAWTPDDLSKQEDKEHVKVTGTAIEITMIILFIVLLNFFLDRIGIYYLGDTGWVSAPILNENILRYIPWITAYSVLDIALNLYLIRMGFWNKFATIAKVLVNAFKIAVLFAIITGLPIITINPTALQTLGFDLATSAQELSQTLNVVLDVLMGLGIFGLVVETIKRLYETFVKGSHTNIKIAMD